MSVSPCQRSPVAFRNKSDMPILPSCWCLCGSLHRYLTDCDGKEATHRASDDSTTPLTKGSLPDSDAGIETVAYRRTSEYNYGIRKRVKTGSTREKQTRRHTIEGMPAARIRKSVV